MSARLAGSARTFGRQSAVVKCVDLAKRDVTTEAALARLLADHD